MYTTLAIVCGLLSITAHELGHYEAMRRCGIRIKEVALLGFPIPYLPSFYLYRKRTLWGVHLFVLGAYVMPADRYAIDDKPLSQQLYMYGNGIVANIVYALVLIGIACLFADFREFRPYTGVIGCGASLAAAALIWWGRKIMNFLLPILALPLALLIAYTIFNISPSESVERGAGGPVAVVTSLTGTTDIANALLAAAMLSLNLGATNLLPFYPLDGGHIFGSIVKKLLGEKAQRADTIVALPLFLAMVVYFLGLDFFRIWKWIF